MKLLESDPFVTIAIDSTTETFCLNEAQNMHRHLTKLFPTDPTIQPVERYKTWNIGKISVWWWLRHIAKEQILRIIRVPFKDDYRIRGDVDDLVIKLMRNGLLYHIQVRTRTTDIPVAPEHKFHMDSISPMVIYVYVTYDPRTFTSSIVGFANWDRLKTTITEIRGSGVDEHILHIPGEFEIAIKNMGSINRAVEWMKGTSNA